MTRHVVLFVAEAVSLAHVARPVVLADSLDPGEFEVHLASSGQFAFCHADRPWPWHRLESIAPDVFLHRLGGGWPVLRADELERYVAADLALIDTVRPRAIIGDFRLSLAVSARLSRVPLLTLCNAHWSPYAARQPVRAPDLALGHWLGFRTLDWVFGALWPLASRWHTVPANRVRRLHGLPVYGSLRELYCDGDWTVFADSPSMVQVVDAPPGHAFIGPLVWSPALPDPEWWAEACSSRRPPVYVTLGSTGSVGLLPAVLDACRLEGLTCLVATAGRSDIRAEPPATYVAPFLSGSRAAQASSFVICNGGSATAHQALAQGRPVLGLCSNLDQVLTMHHVAAAGAGEFMRAGEATRDALRAAIRRLQGDSYIQAATRVRADFEALWAQRRFTSLLRQACAASQPAAASGEGSK